MKVVAVITNRLPSYDLFIERLYPAYREAFRFIKVEDVSRLKGLPLPTMYTCLSLSVAHHESVEVMQRLDSFAVPKFDAFSFTKDTPEISKYL